MKKKVLFLCLLSMLTLSGCKLTIAIDKTNTEPTTESGDNKGQEGEKEGEKPGEDPQNPGEGDEEPHGELAPDGKPYLTVSEALKIASEVGEAGTPQKRYVVGVVKKLINSAYGEMYITDGTNEIYVYGVYSSDGTLKYPDLEEQPHVGDTVYLYGIIKTFKDSPEMGASWLIKFVKSESGPVDLKEYTQVSVLEARNKEAGNKLIIEGVVAKLTYADKMVPNGAFIVDATGSIYVYGIDFASQIKVGNKVKVAGTKTYYIYDKEIDYAEKFGYKGACQLDEGVLLENDKGEHDFDETSIEESTIKDIVETPVSENITTKIYKVNAYVNEVPGQGFTNYYFNDLDNKTGSYAYSLNNGKDYAWLKEFNGKICTVYISPFNCKSTDSGAFFRFVPIKVEYEGFTFEPTKAPEFVLKYYINDQFQDLYSADPALELMTSVSNQDLGFDGVAISYASSDESLISFAEEEGKTIMHVNSDLNGEVTVTCTATYLGTVATSQKVIKISSAVVENALTAKEAIDAKVGDEVVVRGVAGPSTINQKGFYLIDDTGAIAIRTTEEAMGKISLGDEVVFKGIRTNVKAEEGKNVGQIAIDQAELVTNLFGNHQYSDKSFITDKSIEEIQALTANPLVHQTAQIYRTKCYLRREVTNFATKYYIGNADFSKEIYNYAGNRYQFAMFDEFLSDDTVKKELECEFALVNWNAKTYYVACLMSATYQGKKIVNTYNYK